MKRSLLIIISTIILSSLYGQKSIDALFSKYSGKDGFVTVTVSGNLLKLVTCFNSEDDNENSMPANVTEIRILAQEEKSIKSVNFYDMVIDRIDLDDYEEFMRVKESDKDLRMLVRSEGNCFREFLLIAGGEDNAIIQIKGKMTFGEARKFSKNMKKNGELNIGMNSK
jgi:hypothetical protein